MPVEGLAKIFGKKFWLQTFAFEGVEQFLFVAFITLLATLISMHLPLSTRIQVFFSWLVLLPLAAGTCLLVWLDRLLKFRLPFPRDVDELQRKRDWCIGKLKQSGALPQKAVVTDYKVRVLNPSLIFRSNAGIVQVDYSVNGQNHTLKCFAKFAPLMGTVWNKAIFNLQLNHIKEANFNHLFVKADAGLPAPKVYCSELSVITGHLCLITEYMADSKEYLETVYEALPNEHLYMAVEGMAALHARYWNEQSPRMGKVMPVQESTVHFMDSVVAFSWGNAARIILNKSWKYMNRPQTIIHGDSRIGNMMFPAQNGKGRFVFIDWQAVRKGMAVYDLAYFLVLSLQAGHLQREEEECLHTYHSSLVQCGITDYTLEQLTEAYHHACLCVLVLLALPLLSGEVSVEDEAAKYFVWGMGVWKHRLQMRFQTFNYKWVAENYGLTEIQAREAVAEMLNVIQQRLDGIYKPAPGELEEAVKNLRK